MSSSTRVSTEEQAARIFGVLLHMARALGMLSVPAIFEFTDTLRMSTLIILIMRKTTFGRPSFFLGEGGL